MAAAVPAIIALVGTAVQVDAANDAKRASRANARAIEAETTEEARRLREEQAKTESRTRALAAASGGEGQSQSMYMEKQKAEHASELNWLKRSGADRAAAARRGGSIAAKQGYAGALSTAAAAADYSGFGG